jgi:hypothetical protein
VKPQAQTCAPLHFDPLGQSLSDQQPPIPAGALQIPATHRCPAPQLASVLQQISSIGRQVPGWSGYPQRAVVQGQTKAPRQTAAGPHCESRQQPSGVAALQIVDTQICPGPHSVSAEQHPLHVDITRQLVPSQVASSTPIGQS